MPIFGYHKKNPTMPVAFHGSSVLFDRFDLSHVTEGDGKIKFGYGVYLTERYGTAAHYAFNKHRPEIDTFYVYTVEVPELNSDNSIYFDPKLPVPADVVARVEKGLGEKLPVYATRLAKELRRYLSNRLSGRNLTPKQMISADVKDIVGETAAAMFLQSIGYIAYRWPVNWTRPDEMQFALFDENDARIIRVEKVELDGKHQLVEGSQTLVMEF